jgi:hypothetical protein
MAAERRLIAIYLAVSDACRRIVGNGRPRRRGFAPALTDAEAITLEIFAEMQGHHSASAIWRYGDAHWRHFFPTLPTRSVFAKHGADLSVLKQMVQRDLYPTADDIHMTAGFPIGVCKNCRVPRCKASTGEDEAAWGYCASKQEYYFGFHGHLVTNLRDESVAFALTPANVDERLVVRNWFGTLTGLMIGDRGFISKVLDKGVRRPRPRPADPAPAHHAGPQAPGGRPPADARQAPDRDHDRAVGRVLWRRKARCPRRFPPGRQAGEKDPRLQHEPRI